MFRTGAQMFLLMLLAGLGLLRAAHWRPVAAADGVWAEAIAAIDEPLNERFVAWHWRRAPEAAPVVLVKIDANSLTGYPWPWTPVDFSLFLQDSLQFQAAVVAIEATLDWKSVNLSEADRLKLPQYEKILRESLLRCPKVLLGERLGWPDDSETVPPLQAAPVLRHVTGSWREVPEWTAIEEQPKEDYRLTATLGFTNLPYDPAGLDRVPLLLRYQGQIVPSLALQAMLLWDRLAPDDVQVTLGSQIVLGGKRHIPIDEQGRLRVNFASPKIAIGFDELVLASEQRQAQQKTKVPVDRLKGAVALLGRTDPSVQTIRLPLRAALSPAEMFTAAIATMQAGGFLLETPVWFPYAVVALVALAAFWVPRWRKGHVAWWAFGLGIGYAIACLVIFDLLHVTLPLVLPIGLLLFTAFYRAATPNYVWRLRKPVIL